LYCGQELNVKKQISRLRNKLIKWQVERALKQLATRQYAHKIIKEMIEKKIQYKA
jgi:hypothetical protein